MANWCYNELKFRGTEITLLEVNKLIATMIELEAKTNSAQIPDFLNEPDGLFYELKCFDDRLEYMTRWFPNQDAVRGIAEHLRVDVIHRYWENGCQIYGLDIYKGGLKISIPVMSPFLIDEDEYHKQEDELEKICRDIFY